MSLVICFTHNNGVEMPTPKFFTGKMLERWPEYLRDIKRARIFDDAYSAREYLVGFKALRFVGKVVQV